MPSTTQLRLGCLTTIIAISLLLHFYSFPIGDYYEEKTVNLTNSNNNNNNNVQRCQPNSLLWENGKDAGSKIETFGDLEFKLCHEDPKWTNRNRPANSGGECPRGGIVSMISGGRTANRIWEYASIWAVARISNLEPHVPICVRKVVESIFEKLSLPTFDNIAHCPVQLETLVDSVHSRICANQSVIIPTFVFQSQLALVRPWEIRKEFRFKWQLRKVAQNRIKTLTKSLPDKQYTFVGVHVRRTDYKVYLKRKYGIELATRQFYMNAMGHFKNKYPDCVFLYVSDDPDWCLRQFGEMSDVFVVGRDMATTPAEDLALMAACNHTIFDYGTFGEWGAILAGGETVYKNVTENLNKPSTKLLANWVAID